tara:strand:+ start:354 stop:1115 length:762 start_codon:yes stop_codon:yes gene_type:complete
MIGKILQTFPELDEGILIKRYKRFFADIRLKNGETVTAHCANTGPMNGVIRIGQRVRLRNVDSPTRKLKWSWEQAEVVSSDGVSCWVGINTALPNKIVRKVIEAGFLNMELGHISEIKTEVKYGNEGKSRIDLFLRPSKSNPDQRNIYLEVKNTTWTDRDLALFPDTVTQRGQKHLKDMIGVLPDSRAILVPCISRNDVASFAPGDSADPKYGELYRLALNSGVEVFPCCFGFFASHITWEGLRPFRKSQYSS